MTRAGGLLFALALALAGCDRLTSAEEAKVRRWVLCEECAEGELDSVVALGDRAVGMLGEALRGPPAERRKTVVRQAQAMVSRTPTTATIRQAYVEHYVRNYEAAYQTRAAQALDRIGTPSADAALRQAVRGDRPYRDDVVQVIGQSAGATLTLVAGDSQHAPVDSLVRVNPTVLVRIGPSQEPVSAVRVVFQVDSGEGMVLDSVRYTDSDGRAAARWRLGPADSAVNILTARAGGQTVRFYAIGHALEPRVVFTTQPHDGRVAQPLLPVVSVAVHDAWGAVAGNFNQAVAVSVEGTNIGESYPLADGEAKITGFTIPAAGTFYLLAETSGAITARSDSFQIVP